MVEKVFPAKFSYEAVFVKTMEDERGKYLILRASDTSIDRDNERVTPELLNHMKRLARTGKLQFLDHHRATIPLGYVVDFEERDDGGFYPIVKLDETHPLAETLFNQVKEGKAIYGVSIGGRNPKFRISWDRERGRVAEIVEAEIDHIALTRRGYEANPNTSIVTAIMKEVKDDLEAFLKEVPLGTVLEQVEKIPVELPEDRKKREKTLAEIAEAVKKQLAVLSKSEYLAEFEAAKEHALNSMNTSVLKREAQYGYRRGVYACGTKPPVWQRIPVEKFADPVGYFYPMDDLRLEHSYRKFLKGDWEDIYLPTSASKIYLNFVKEMIARGRTVNYFDNPILAATLPMDIKVQLEGFDPATDVIYSKCFALYEKEHEQRYSLRSEVMEYKREGAYPFPRGGNIENPYPDLTPEQYADPVGYRFPIHTINHCFMSLIYFEKWANDYTLKGQEIVFNNLVKGALIEGLPVPFEDKPLFLLLVKEVRQKLIGYDEDVEKKCADAERRQRQITKEQEITKGIEEQELIFTMPIKEFSITELAQLVKKVNPDDFEIMHHVKFDTVKNRIVGDGFVITLKKGVEGAYAEVKGLGTKVVGMLQNILQEKVEEYLNKEVEIIGIAPHLFVCYDNENLVALSWWINKEGQVCVGGQPCVVQQGFVLDEDANVTYLKLKSKVEQQN